MTTRRLLKTNSRENDEIRRVTRSITRPKVADKLLILAVWRLVMPSYASLHSDCVETIPILWSLPNPCRHLRPSGPRSILRGCSRKTTPSKSRFWSCWPHICGSFIGAVQRIRGWLSLGTCPFCRVGLTGRLRSCQDIWSSEFACIGVNEKSMLYRDSPSAYLFYATGRRDVLSVYSLIEVSSFFFR